MSVRIVSYNSRYEKSILDFENGITQGKNVKLRIEKLNFLDRSIVFKKTYPCLAIEDNKIVGSIIGAQTELIVNDVQFNAGFGFDLKVHPAYRRKGIAKMMSDHVYRDFFKAEGLDRNFITLKLSNTAVVSLINRIAFRSWLYKFVYLTIPTKIRIEPDECLDKRSQFLVSFFKKEELPDEYTTSFINGLSYFHTYKLYRLRVFHLSNWFQFVMRMIKMGKPRKFSLMPDVNEMIEFATLYNHTPDNIHVLNDVLVDLEMKGKKYLLVCCRKHDGIYNYLKRYSINTYEYCILSDFSLEKNDSISIDVRCL